MSDNEIGSWLRGRLPEDWFDGEPEVTVDRDEILVVGRLAGGAETDTTAAEGRIARFREETRERRIGIARETERRYGRKVAWGARVGDTTVLFTRLSVPVMTRLRQPERVVLDTLVDAGVARSRSEALAWCVRLVARHTEDWLTELRQAMESVREVRERGPEESG